MPSYMVLSRLVQVAEPVEEHRHGIDPEQVSVAELEIRIGSRRW
jgi:hypothetical protein